MRINNTEIGPGHPCYVVAEIGINHNGTLNKALQLIDAAADAGANAVKFQKRTPEVVTPADEWDKPREMPWGETYSYIDYRRHLELKPEAWPVIVEHCKGAGLDWFASCWDVTSVDFIEQFEPHAHKIASAMNTNHVLMQRVAETMRPVILSTGMADAGQTFLAAAEFVQDRLALLHCVGAYPVADSDINLAVMESLRRRFPSVGVVGYSGHERGIATSVAAVALGADIVERHLTLDRTDWGSDHAASLEPHGFKRLVRDIRAVEDAIGSPEKRFYDIERDAAHKLRYHERNAAHKLRYHER